ncbi:MAG TPA: flagellar biosynthesis protein FlhA, partial [Spirochaetota bacterium]|nr:flagellar biosynthesis protein FlhA [Spirochaetota bacterium]
MSDLKKNQGFNLIQAIREPSMIFAVFLIIVVLMLIIPVPAFLLDLLMALSVLSGIMIILTVAYLKTAVDFSIFPTVLLVSTLFRLAVNVSSTRLILSQGVQFDGKMVRAFGDFVVGTKDASGLVIGIIIFAILTLVQFIVITRGATRVSEVAARFSLDSMPNKYMAIDMDVQNGVIDEKEAIRRRLELQEESSFFGSMDGASKFVQGDVIIGIIITFINIIGGFTVGMLIRGEDFNIALKSYVQLTIGDGLVSQIPSLLISTATGLIVTRSQAKEALGASVWKQLSNQYKIFYISGVTLALLALLPGFPHIILALLAGGMIAAGYFLQKAETEQKVAKEQKKEQKDEPKGPENVTGLLKVDPLSLFIGYELIPLVDKSKGAELLDSIGSIRRTFAMEMGLIVPPIRILDNLKLLPNEYSFQIRGQEIGKGRIKVGYLMAMGESSDEIDGEKTLEPAFGLPALWIKNDLREKAESLGFTVVDIPTIISTHIQELLKHFASEILGREETTQIIDNLRNDYPNVVEDVLKGYSKAQIQKILQQLLKEGISIKDLPTIFETLGDHNPQTSYFDLIEFVRQALRRAICNKYVDEQKKLHILRIHPKIENDIYKSITIEQDGTPIVRLNPESLQRIQSVIRDKVMEMYEG